MMYTTAYLSEFTGTTLALDNEMVKKKITECIHQPLSKYILKT